MPPVEGPCLLGLRFLNPWTGDQRSDWRGRESARDPWRSLGIPVSGGPEAQWQPALRC